MRFSSEKIRKLLIEINQIFFVIYFYYRLACSQILSSPNKNQNVDCSHTSKINTKSHSTLAA